MSKNFTKNDLKLLFPEDRAGWVSKSKIKELGFGKKRFNIYKNFSSVIIKDSTGLSSNIRKSVPERSLQKKYSEDHLLHKKVADLENQLYQKKSQIKILNNLFDYMSRKFDDKQHPITSRNLKNSSVNEFKFPDKVASFKNSHRRSLPEIGDIDYRTPANAKKFDCLYPTPKMNSGLFNPITGTLSYQDTKARY